MNHESFQANNPYATFGASVANSADDARATFLKKTYLHLVVSVYLFAALEWVLLTAIPEATIQRFIQTVFGGMGYLLFFAAFIGVSWIADSWARSNTSRAMQYLGLTLYIVAEAIFFLPLLYFAQKSAIDYGLPGGTDVITAAGIITLVMFAGLTAIVFITGKDFSFLGSFLWFAGLAAMGVMLCGWLFGFSLGVFFSVAMIALASGYILYETSAMMRHYRTDQYVAASLALFASVMLMFWYVLRLLMALSDRR